MILLGIVYGAVTGNMQAVTDAVFASAKEAVTLCITMTGMMALWVGVMEIARGAGLIRKWSEKLKPFIHFLFPGIPKGHKAQEYIAANMIANILGLGSAATPAGLKAMEELAEIKGEKGTTVELTVLRGENAKEVTVTATRDTVQAQTIEYKLMDDKIGYIRVSEFDTVTYDQYEEALDDLEKQGMTGLVVDLRNNPGGSLSTVCDMLDLMLPKGLIVYTEDKDGKKTEMKSDEEHQFTKPLAVLVNGNSASASEIYSGAIQDYGIGKIVGTQTYGKGVVQQIFDLDDGTAVKLTIAEYFTPKGRSINGKGITPDVKIKYQSDEENPDADNQLEKAVETVKAQMK